MGVKSAFKNKADFKGILADNLNLTISEVVHKAFIEVEEEGTTAAVATDVSLVPVVRPHPPIPPALFHADHPFLFYLRLNKLGINFFVGRYVSP
ncbi:hypothetical protein ILUMI_11060 [Ignelater luminosus]|uniref:Serpin domain-containing protein n=1 Tax=Ignelater luminosus TaxID=2038154 RepID=A0A8K0CWR8_IGNLU|nr:hypothetical protein ILUMI_11060 [Ignelater luminosus]